MKNWIPEPGMLLYAEAQAPIFRLLGRLEVGIDLNDRARGFGGMVLRCVAVDEHAVVADVVWVSSGDSRRHVLARSEYVCRPVGPEVVVALGLTVEPEPAVQSVVSGELTGQGLSGARAVAAGAWVGMAGCLKAGGADA